MKFFFHTRSKERTITHTLNAEIGSKDCPTVERYIKSRKELYVPWENAEDDGK